MMSPTIPPGSGASAGRPRSVPLASKRGPDASSIFLLRGRYAACGQRVVRRHRDVLPLGVGLLHESAFGPGPPTWAVQQSRQLIGIHPPHGGARRYLSVLRFATAKPDAEDRPNGIVNNARRVRGGVSVKIRRSQVFDRPRIVAARFVGRHQSFSLIDPMVTTYGSTAGSAATGLSSLASAGHPRSACNSGCQYGCARCSRRILLHATAHAPADCGGIAW